MNQSQIEIIVHPDGSLQIDAHGFKGKSCLEATAFLEHALGEVKDYKTKPEYNQGVSHRCHQRVGHG